MEQPHTVTPVISETPDGQEFISDFQVDHIHAFDHVDLQDDPAFIDAVGPDQIEHDTELNPQQQILWDWAEENLSSEHLDYLAEQLDGADSELIEAHMHELEMIRAEMQGEEALKDPNDNKILPEEKETFNSIVEDLAATEPAGDAVANDFFQQSEQFSEEPLMRDMLIASGFYHQGKADASLLAERLIDKYGKYAVYQAYEQFSANG